MQKNNSYSMNKMISVNILQNSGNQYQELFLIKKIVMEIFVLMMRKVQKMRVLIRPIISIG